MTRSFATIAQEIDEDWSEQGKGVNYAAKPYLEAMAELDTTDPNTPYGFGDDARTVVLYFLSNATSWRGETARKIKAELKGMVKR